MKEIKTTCYKGTRILLGNEKRIIIDKMIEFLIGNGFEEISIPIIQHREIFKGKVGEENNNLMFNFKDRGDRDLCLAPEYTAVVQKLAQTEFKHQKDVKLFYVQECFRGEKPQAGRYRQFTQLGVEVLNPSPNEESGYNWETYLPWMSKRLIEFATEDYEFNSDVTRGLDYYKGGKGFEIRSEDGMQLCGGGVYDGGVGFAIGIDRIILKS